MTGLPQFNIPAFDLMAERLRNVGHGVLSPAELDSEAAREYALSSEDGKLDSNNQIRRETWGDMLARDVKIVSDVVDGIVVLPGWENSRGARLEVFVALLCDKPVYEDNNAVGDPHLVLLPRLEIVFTIARSFCA
jgi:hypothetical protein